VSSSDAIYRPVVKFVEFVEQWNRHSDCSVSYVTAKDFPLTSRDWIGLYKVRRCLCLLFAFSALFY